MTSAIFATRDAFDTTFMDGLTSIADAREMPASMLVAACANACVLPGFNLARGAKLDDLVRQWCADLAYRALGELSNDEKTIRNIGEVGLAALQVEFKPSATWSIQLNPIRAKRPPGAAAAKVEGLSLSFDSAKPNWHKTFPQECFHAGAFAGRSVALYYNKFPFAGPHSVVVPDRNDNRPQFLTRDYHEWAWDFVEAHESLSGVGMGYNSIGAFASFNHLHFQMFMQPDPLPVARDGWLHNRGDGKGGAEPYPAQCVRVDSKKAAWEWLADIHQQQVAYNLLYMPGRVYCFPRRHQGTYEHASWTSGFAWYELSGGMITSNREDFERLRPEDVRDEFRKLRCDMVG